MKILLLIIILMLFGCAQSTHTFDPTLKQDIAEEIPKQATAVKIESGMNCRDLLELEIKYCRSKTECRNAERKLAKIIGSGSCKVYYNRNEIKAIRRAYRR